MCLLEASVERARRRRVGVREEVRVDVRSEARVTERSIVEGVVRIAALIDYSGSVYTTFLCRHGGLCVAACS